jgi:hypothetical protein
MKWIGGGRLPRTAFALVVAALLAVPAAASAAKVVNGDFETGTLSGWDVHVATSAGNWFAYSGTTTPLSGRAGAIPIQPPPRGHFAAVADEADPETAILSQEVALEPFRAHRLSLLAFYDSVEPIAVPNPDTLAVDPERRGTGSQQQFRIDVMRAGSPIESLDPADILTTLYGSHPGDPLTMKPTPLTADLTPWAGQAVRIRVAVAAQEEILNAGVDAVAITSSAAPGEPLPPIAAKHFILGKPKQHRKTGVVNLPVQVPGAGELEATRPGRIKRAATNLVTAETIELDLEPVGKALKTLKRKGKLKAAIEIRYQPLGAQAQTATATVVFRLAPKQRRHR